jgi:hypothetical protein
MRAQPTSEQDSSFTITPVVRPRMPWRVVKVQAFPGYQLRVDFVDGIQGMVDMKALVHSSTAGVFAELADPARFARVFVEHGAVTWPGNIDLAPDAMHAAIKLAGTWVLG